MNSNDIKQTLILFIIVMGLNGLSNPSTDALSSQYVDREHKGRFNSFFKISKILGQAMGSNYYIIFNAIRFYKKDRL